MVFGVPVVFVFVVFVVVVVVAVVVCQMVIMCIYFPCCYFQIVCISFAAGIVYFFCVALSWMLVEGVQLYLRVTRVFKGKQKMALYYSFAWGKTINCYSEEKHKKFPLLRFTVKKNLRQPNTKLETGKKICKKVTDQIKKN